MSAQFEHTFLIRTLIWEDKHNDYLQDVLSKSTGTGVSLTEGHQQTDHFLNIWNRFDNFFMWLLGVCMH